MRSDVIRIYRDLHTWTGLISGMALFICFYAGALSMFKEPLSRWATPPGQPAFWTPPEHWPELIRATLEQYPETKAGFTLHVQANEHLPASLTWKAGEERFQVNPQAWSSLDDDGNLVSGHFSPAPLAELVDLLHRTAGIPGGGHHPLGVYVMGVICVLDVLALVSGLVVLLPTLTKDLFAIRNGTNRKRFWLDTHNVVGLFSLPFHLVIGLSVIVFAFHDQIYDSLEKWVYPEPLWERPTVENTARDPADLVSPVLLLERVAQIAPDFIPRELHYYDVDSTAAQVRISGQTWWQPQRDGARGLVTMDPYTGTISSTTYLPGHENTWSSLINSFFSLHFGNFGGTLGQWLYLILGLSGAYVFYSGNLLWVEARRRRQRRGTLPVHQKRAARLMAAATVGVCWGAVAGISTAVLIGRWLATREFDLAGVYLWSYYGIFFAALGWAFLRGAARSAVDLLYLCAMTTLAIPLSGVLGWLLPELPVWLHESPDLWLVDVTALLFGLIFCWMARGAANHLATNGPDTVWTLVMAHRKGRSSLGEPQGQD